MAEDKDKRPQYEPPRARDLSETFGPVRGRCAPGSGFSPFCVAGFSGQPVRGNPEQPEP
jgi:hypothetical protein